MLVASMIWLFVEGLLSSKMEYHLPSLLVGGHIPQVYTIYQDQSKVNYLSIMEVLPSNKTHTYPEVTLDRIC